MQSSPTQTSSASPAPVTLWQAIKFWLRLGFISFGGPAGQIAIMHQELVEQRRWISEQRFLHALNYCMLLPGPEAQQLATYIGWLMHRTWGGIIAGVLFVLPSLFILILLSWLYIAYGHLTLIAGIFYGIKPAVAAIVVQAAHRIGSRSLKNNWLWGIAFAAFVAIFALHLPFPLIVLAAGISGWLGGKFAPHLFAASTKHQANQKNYGAAIIDDTTPTPEHAKFRIERLTLVLACGLIFWAIPMLLLGNIFGWQHGFTQMAWFFTTAALLTFGGAYAVLPYVYQGAVTHYQWLTPAQMMDGLALGETTPGPLIMVVAFVGFVGAYTQEFLGGESLFLAGAIAATLVTWFTFLPSFVFILAGGPLVESTKSNLHFTAPLTAITAAVVGVIINLALFFAYHTLWPEGIGAGAITDWIKKLDLIALAIGVIASGLLFWGKQGIIRVLGICALLGMAVKMLH
ncbi:chromate efflux transporter [Cellvibrio sp. NN19]|uniref:chromate efflux transporter n=1 Tax=Cellvibrio chitinivorans TaxID=3102792 RepID=UPI002B401ED7|nr:chromate efflux transporter [Cellvibrio sp. NN19]